MNVTELHAATPSGAILERSRLIKMTLLHVNKHWDSLEEVYLVPTGTK